MNTKKTIFALVVIAALVAVILLFSKSDNTNNDQLTTEESSEVVATAGEEVITAGELQRATRIFQQNPQTQSITQEQVLAQLINQKLLYQKAVKSGTKIQNGDLDTAFGQALANFGSEEVLQTELGFTTDEFREFLEEQLITQEYVNSLRGDFNVTITDEQIQAAFDELASQTEEEVSLEELGANIAQYLEEQAFQEYLAGEIESLQDEYVVEIISEEEATEEVMEDETVSEESSETTEMEVAPDENEEVVE